MQNSTQQNQSQPSKRAFDRTRWLHQSSVGAIVFSSCLGLIAALGLASIAQAETAKWNQAKVTALANELSKATRALYDAEYKAPEMGFAAGGGDAHFGFMDTLRRLEHETKHLASSLQKGADAKSTKGSYLHIHEMLDDLAEERRFMDLLAPVKKDFEQVRTLAGQLMAYYGD
jgi:hypothetical protein